MVHYKKMSCNLDLLHVGIWTFYTGCSLLVASAINFRILTPIENAAMLDERTMVQNKIKAKQNATQTSSQYSLPVVDPPSARKRLKFLV